MTGRMMLLPPAADACQVCAAKHEPHEPHNAQSLYWATARAMAGEPSPTWEDALAHVEEPLRSAWVKGLRERGVEVS